MSPLTPGDTHIGHGGLNLGALHLSFKLREVEIGFTLGPAGVKQTGELGLSISSKNLSLVSASGSIFLGSWAPQVPHSPPDGAGKVLVIFTGRQTHFPPLGTEDRHPEIPEALSASAFP